MFSFLLIGSLILSGCSQSNSTGSLAGSDNGESGKKFTVVTSFYPMYISTINVTKDVPEVEVINMTKPQTGCLHDYTLKPEDLKILEKADAFVINGAGMESFMDKIMSQQKNLKIIEASRGIELIKDENGEENPHVWVSISDSIQQVKNISGQLAEVDPENASKYKDNSEVYIKKLEAFKDKMHESLKGVENKDIVTFHEAFPYFAKEFDLNIVDVIEREPDTAPSPKELEDTIEIIRDSKVKAVFAEPQYNAKAADTIARETGVKIYSLDPGVTGEANPEGYDEYINIMEQNLKSLEEALK
jgi:zinc transport system substrate-binding protein